jgi:hypothetical protein
MMGVRMKISERMLSQMKAFGIRDVGEEKVIEPLEPENQP